MADELGPGRATKELAWSGRRPAMGGTKCRAAPFQEALSAFTGSIEGTARPVGDFAGA